MKFPIRILFPLLATLAPVYSGQDAIVVSPRNDREQSPVRMINPNSVHQRVWYRGRHLAYQEVNGLAIVEGDIVLGPVSSLKGQEKSSGRLDASIITDTSYRWPKGVVSYVIEPNPKLEAMVQAAIRHWEQKTSYRFLPRLRTENYVRFTTVDEGCYSYVGMIGGAQPINLGEGCDTGSAIHEIGHSIGLWHEQSRNDRDDYVQVLFDNIDPEKSFNFDKTGPDGTDVGYYDYGSIMHYPDWGFSINGRSTIVTIPPGILIGQTNGLSAGDIDAVERMNGATQRPFVVTTNPPGFDVLVDGVSCTTPCAFTNWTAGSRHTISVDSFERTSQAPVMHGFFARWNDNGAPSHEIVVDPVKAVVSASFYATEEGDLPDLVVTALTGPVDVTVGEQPAQVYAEVKNVGKIDAGPFNLSFYLSGDSNITRSDRYLGWYCRFETGLAVGATGICRGTIDLPADLATGAYYFGAVADDRTEIGESNELNNTLANQNGTTQVHSSVAALPDLAVTAFSAPATGAVGGRLAGSRIEIRNRGQGAAERFRAGVYLSKSPTITTDSTYTRWSCTAENGLTAGDTFTCTGDIGIPSGLAPGAYYLGVIADDLGDVQETEEGNNVRLNDQGRINLGPEVSPKPDLVVSALTAPTDGFIGQRLSSVGLEVINQGGARAGAFRVGFYFSATPAVSTASISTGRSCTAANGLAPGESLRCSVEVEIPASLSPGTYYFGAIADDLSQVTESDESNNVRLNGDGPVTLKQLPRPDLVVTSFRAPVTGNIGDRVSEIRVAVKNQGNSRAGSFRVGLYIAPSSIISVANTFSGSSCTATDGLAPGDTFTCSGEMAIPASLSTGTYYLGAIADDLRQVAESDETNNARQNDNGPSLLYQTPRPDLVVISFTAPTTGVAGGTVSGARVVVKNQGSTQADPFRIGFYIAGAFTGWYCMVTNAVVPGDTFTCTNNVGVPSDLPPGTYSLTAVADDLKRIVESDETNNSRANDNGPIVIAAP